MQSVLLEAGRVSSEEAIHAGHGATFAPLPLFVVDARIAVRFPASPLVPVSQQLQSKNVDEWCNDRAPFSQGLALPSAWSAIATTDLCHAMRRNPMSCCFLIHARALEVSDDTVYAARLTL